jgi:flagellar L-ring protein precursor FlgH
MTLLLLAGLLVSALTARADSIWERRDPRSAYMFWDYRARQVGDLLTIVVNETTAFDSMEMRQLNKQTLTSSSVTVDASAVAGQNMKRTYSGSLDGTTTSQRKLDGLANSTIDRKFTDRMTVTVIDLLPNGNLIIEGYRRRVVNGEVRTLKVRGMVRSADIGPSNTVQSQFIADFEVSYVGRGGDTSATNHGWLGRMMNHLWPF